MANQYIYFIYKSQWAGAPFRGKPIAHPKGADTSTRSVRSTHQKKKLVMTVSGGYRT